MSKVKWAIFALLATGLAVVLAACGNGNTGPTTYTVTIVVTGEGSVNYGGKDCASGQTCTESVAEGSSLTLVAGPNAGATFTSWNGGGCPTDGTTSCTVTSAATVTATFSGGGTGGGPFTLAVAVTGDGVVTGAPGNIDCSTANPAGCSAEFTAATSVTLTAAPSQGSGAIFSGWGGDCASAGSATSCTVNVDGVKNVSASFVQTTLTINIASDLDDAEEFLADTGVAGFPANTTTTDSSDLELTIDPGYPGGDIDQEIGLLFRQVGIPPKAKITGATISFTARSTKPGVGAPALNVYGEANVTPGNFKNKALMDISGRTKTTAVAQWFPETWTTGNVFSTVDFANVAQEIVCLDGWAENNSMVYIITGPTDTGNYRAAASAQAGGVTTLTISFDPNLEGCGSTPPPAGP